MITYMVISGYGYSNIFCALCARITLAIQLPPLLKILARPLNITVSGSYFCFMQCVGGVAPQTFLLQLQALSTSHILIFCVLLHLKCK